MTEDSLRTHLVGLLTDGYSIQVTWDTGSDEGILNCYLAGELLMDNHPLGNALIDYLVIYLTIPFQGDFSLKGTGAILLEQGQLYLHCRSSLDVFEEGLLEGDDFRENITTYQWEKILDGTLLLFSNHSSE